MKYLVEDTDRIDSIIYNTDEKFAFEHQSVYDIPAFSDGISENSLQISFPFVEININLQQNSRAGEYVRSKQAEIRAAANEFGISPDLLSAVIYTEQARGWYDAFDPFPNTVRPGNIGHEWERLIPGSDVNNESDNLRLSAKLISEIAKRLDNPYAEDIYALYNNIAADRTYHNKDLKSTPYFLKRALEDRAWEYENWNLEIADNGVLDPRSENSPANDGYHDAFDRILAAKRSDDITDFLQGLKSDLDKMDGLRGLGDIILNERDDDPNSGWPDDNELTAANDNRKIYLNKKVA